jgi:hypothetical protein
VLYLTHPDGAIMSVTRVACPVPVQHASPIKASPFYKETETSNSELFHWSLHHYLTRTRDPLQDDIDQD